MREAIRKGEIAGEKIGRKRGMAEGKEIGIAEGKEIGIAEGRAEGRAEGIAQEKINNIKAMLENKADYEFISKVSGKTIDEIKEIENSMNN